MQGCGCNSWLEAGASKMAEKVSKQHMLPVWFFIGVILLIYGIIICWTGIYEIWHPPSTVLANLHAPIWWGGLLSIIGVFYISQYRPGRQ
jgi:hypothetical protein